MSKENVDEIEVIATDIEIRQLLDEFALETNRLEPHGDDDLDDALEGFIQNFLEKVYGEKFWDIWNKKF